MNCSYTVNNGDLSREELAGYYAHATEKFGREPKHMDITVDGEFVDIDYTFTALPFERIRRITGYLVGTLDRFNNGKRAEENERVKHTVDKE